MVIEDQASRRMAVDIKQSLITQAPAGSGKTTLLVERYLALLSVVAKPEEILAITFTRKAAAEMRARVLVCLDPAGESGDVDPLVRAAAIETVKARDWQLSKVPNRLKIQTIDSFTRSVVVQLPLGSKFSTNTRQLENPEAYLEQAVQLVLLNLYKQYPLNHHIIKFLQVADNDVNRGQRLLVDMLKRRDEWIDIASSVFATANQTERSLATHLLPAYEQLINTLTNELTVLLRQRVAELSEYLACKNPELKLDPTTLDYWLEAADLILKGDGKLRATVTVRQGFAPKHPRKQDMLDFLDSLGDHPALDKLAEIRGLTPVTDNSEQITSVCVVLMLAALELQTLFQRSNSADFMAWQLAAQNALGEEQAPTDLALMLDYRINHVLVDEFQDTSFSQFDFFRRLLQGWQPGDGRTFFAVGDPMQSIYSFRSAQVELFLNATQSGVGTVALTPIKLATNFRSNAGIIQWINQTFSTILGDHSDPLRGKIAYSPSIAYNPQVDNSSVDLLAYGTAEDEAQATVYQIQQLMLEEPSASIALLVRSRSHASHIISAFKQANLSWKATDMDLLAGVGVVQDLLVLHQCLLDPTNLLAIVSLLRSPLFGMALPDLEQVASLHSHDQKNPNWLAQADNKTDLSALFTTDGAAVFRRFVHQIHEARQQIFEDSPRALVENCWLRLGGNHAYMDNDVVDQAQRFFAVLDALGNQAYDLATLELEIGKLYAADQTQACIEILTIHKAKGLEFDHVFVPHIQKYGKDSAKPLVHWLNNDAGLVIGANGVDGPYEWLHKRQRQRESNEIQRLLYVACTRAKSTLTLSAVILDPTRPADRRSFLSLLAKQMPRDDNGDWVLEPAPASTSETGQSTAERHRQTGAKERRLPSNYQWQAPAYQLPSVIRATQSDLPDQPTREVEATTPQMLAGTLTHQALYLLSLQQLPSNAEQCAAALHPLWLEAISSEQLDEQTENIISIVTRCLENTLQDPQGRWLLKAQQQAQSEFPITYWNGREFERIVVDRTFVDENGARWIVDYKTATPKNKTLTDFIAEEVSYYRPQLMRYQDSISKLYGTAPARLALYFPGVPHFEEIL